MEIGDKGATYEEGRVSQRFIAAGGGVIWKWHREGVRK